MNWLSTMKIRSNLAASASRACSMYQFDVDAGVARDLGVEPEVVLAGAARAHGDGAELELPLPRGHACAAFDVVAASCPASRRATSSRTSGSSWRP